MSKNHCDTLVVSIPPALFDLPVKIVRGNGANELVCYMKAGEEHMSVINHAEHIDKYVFVRCNDSYKKIEISNILWASADRSYSEIHLTDNTTIVLSFPLSVVEKSLPTIDFVHIHRSVLLNLKHVDRMCGNTLYVGKTNFTIGREYRESTLRRMVFIGVRNKQNSR